MLKLIIFVTFSASFCKGDGLIRIKRQDDQKLKVVSILEKPFLMQGTNGSYEGYIVDLMDKVSNILGLEYEIYLSPDGKYGQTQDDGTWNGIVGEIIRRNADLAAAPLTITSVRERVMDFSKPFMTSGNTILFKKPRISAPNAAQIFSYLFLPFEGMTWTFIIHMMLLFWFLTYLLKYKLRKPVYDSTESSKIKTECNFCYKAFLTVIGIKDENEPISVVILYAAWRFFIFFTLFLYIIGLWVFSFSSSTSVYKMPITSFDDLVRSNIKAGYMAEGSTHNFFRTSKFAVFERFYTKVENTEPSTLVSSTEEAVERVQNGDYAFIGESAMIEYVTSRICDLTQVGGLLNKVGYGLATPLGSELRDRITLALLELQENGVLQKLYRKWWYIKGVCPKDVKPESESQSPKFGYSVVYATRLFYVYGGITAVLCAIAMIVRALELLLSKKKKNSVSLKDNCRNQETVNC